MMTREQFEMVQYARAFADDSQVYESEDSDDVLVIFEQNNGAPYVVSVGRTGATSSSMGGEWESGFEF